MHTSFEEMRLTAEHEHSGVSGSRSLRIVTVVNHFPIFLSVCGKSHIQTALMTSSPRLAQKNGRPEYSYPFGETLGTDDMDQGYMLDALRILYYIYEP